MGQCTLEKVITEVTFSKEKWIRYILVHGISAIKVDKRCLHIISCVCGQSLLTNQQFRPVLF